MRLPDSPEAGARIAGAGSSQRGLDFGWMMRIVINDSYSVGFAPDLEPASGSGELAQCLGCSASGRSSNWATVNAASALQDIMFTRNLQFNRGRVTQHGGAECEAAFSVDRQDAGIYIRSPVHSRRWASDRRQCTALPIFSAFDQQGTRTRVFGAGHQCAVCGEMLDEFHKGSLEICQGGVAIRVVVLDVGDHFDGGLQAQEHAVVFVGFDDESVAFPVLGR